LKGSAQGWVRDGIIECEGRPTVWNTRQVCKEANRQWFASRILSPHLTPTC